MIDSLAYSIRGWCDFGQAFESEPRQGVEGDDEVREVWDMALKLEGLSAILVNMLVVIAPGKH